MAHTVATLEADWRVWLRTLFPAYYNRGGTGAFAAYHVEFWDWVWSIRAGVRPRPFIALWPRGAAKSTNAETACVALGARGARRYVLYVSGTQALADRHVQSIASRLESRSVEALYPRLAARALNKYGAAKGWSRQRLRTDAGLTIDALGLDTAIRGARIDEDRPSLIILDDIDDKHDSLDATERKIEAITTALLPTGAPACGVLFVQNLIHPTSIASRLADRDPEHAVSFLVDRIVSGPHPAILDLTYERQGTRDVITGGTPTWAGQDLAVCQDAIDQDGLTSFLAERQHDVTARPGGLFDHVQFVRKCRDEAPDLVSIQVWVDPAVTDRDDSDSHGISAGGIDEHGRVWILYAWERRTSPEDSLRRAWLIAYALGADTLGIETDQGGDTWLSVARESLRTLLEQGLIPKRWTAPRLLSERAGSVGSKIHRGGQLLAAYQQDGVWHVTGEHARLEALLWEYETRLCREPKEPATGTAYRVLEAALRRFPKTKPLDLADATFWLVHRLTDGGQFGVAVATPGALGEHPNAMEVLDAIGQLARQTARQREEARARAEGRDPVDDEDDPDGEWIAVADSGGMPPGSLAGILERIRWGR